jgi:L-lactate dehydrogenase complex protein LldE
VTSTALFVTCLVDQFFPRVGEAAVQLLEEVGCRVEFPEAQTCCGQPAFNMGYRDEARSLARRFLEIFEPYEAIVSPSGSCASMARVFAPQLFDDEPSWSVRARDLAKRTFELTEYLDARGLRPSARFEGQVVYHPSCHLLRELDVDRAPRALLSRVTGLELVNLEGATECCGFGGAFSVKFPELSSAILDSKLHAVEESGAEVLTAADAGCLMQIGGGLARRGSQVRVLHLAELLAGMT